MAPAEAIALFGPWVSLTQEIMDGDGAWVCMLWPGAYMDQPEPDMKILSIVRRKLNELRIRDIKNGH